MTQTGSGRTGKTREWEREIKSLRQRTRHTDTHQNRSTEKTDIHTDNVCVWTWS